MLVFSLQFLTLGDFWLKDCSSSKAPKPHYQHFPQTSESRTWAEPGRLVSGAAVPRGAKRENSEGRHFLVALTLQSASQIGFPLINPDMSPVKELMLCTVSHICHVPSLY